MEKEVCMFYEPINIKTNRLCKHFKGKNTERNVERCRYHCSIMEVQEVIDEGEVMHKVNGRWRNNKK